MESQAMNESSDIAAWTGPAPFVILHHTGSPDAPDHFDLLLDAPPTPGGKLLTWRLLPHPDTWPHHPPTAIRLPNHRRHYLTYEGPISDNRGHVRRVAAGSATLRTLNAHTLTLTLSPLNTDVTLPV